MLSVPYQRNVQNEKRGRKRTQVILAYDLTYKDAENSQKNKCKLKGREAAYMPQKTYLIYE